MDWKIDTSDLTATRYYAYSASDALVVLLRRICSPYATRRFDSSSCNKMSQTDYPQYEIKTGTDVSQNRDLSFDYMKKPTKSTAKVLRGVGVIDEWFAKRLLGPRGSNPDLPFAALLCRDELYREWITLVRMLTLVLKHVPKAKVKEAHDMILELYPNYRRRSIFIPEIKESDIHDIKNALRSLVRQLSSRTNILEWPEAAKYPTLFEELAREKRSQETQKTSSTKNLLNRRNARKRRRLSSDMAAERPAGKWKNRLRSTQ